jgi:hypothetical protein
MPARVTLTVTRGPLTGKAFVFDERSTCYVGRHPECQIRVPDDEAHRMISRHHCLLDINPPDVRVRDFGSRNGTWLNGKLIGQRESHQSVEEARGLQFPEHDLKDGDQIGLGTTSFRVAVFKPAACSECGVEIPEAERKLRERLPGVYQCAACRRKAELANRPDPPKPKPKCCARCGKDVTGQPGADRPGDFVCPACQADPFELVRRLLELANAGDSELPAIQGYAIERELGRGGMGAVYLARHERTGERVALKVMLPKVALNEDAKQRFLRETENTRALKHPNIVELKDGGCSNGTFFFTLEFCDGGSVDQLMRARGGRLPIDEAIEITFQALDGLEYAHAAELRPAAGGAPARGVVHRDLKPQNIFLSTSGGSRTVKVADFGLAKAFDTAGLSGLTCTGSAAGTPQLMPRQQVINFKYARPEVDVWAMAASLYWMLTGVVPRDFPRGKDPWQVVLQSDPVPIRNRDPGLPRKLADVLDQALTDRTGLCFKSATELRRALRSAFL